MCLELLYKLSQMVLVLKRTERDMINKMYIGLHLQYSLFLSDFNETWIFSTYFRKILKYQISRKSFWWEPSCSMLTHGWTDRRTDMTRIITFIAILRRRLKIKIFTWVRLSVHTRIRYVTWNVLHSFELLENSSGIQAYVNLYPFFSVELSLCCN